MATVDESYRLQMDSTRYESKLAMLSQRRFNYLPLVKCNVFIRVRFSKYTCIFSPTSICSQRTQLARTLLKLEKTTSHIKNPQVSKTPLPRAIHPFLCPFHSPFLSSQWSHPCTTLCGSIPPSKLHRKFSTTFLLPSKDSPPIPLNLIILNEVLGLLLVIGARW